MTSSSELLRHAHRDRPVPVEREPLMHRHFGQHESVRARRARRPRCTGWPGFTCRSGWARGTWYTGRALWARWTDRSGGSGLSGGSRGSRRSCGPWRANPAILARLPVTTIGTVRPGSPRLPGRTRRTGLPRRTGRTCVPHRAGRTRVPWRARYTILTAWPRRTRGAGRTRHTLEDRGCRDRHRFVSAHEAGGETHPQHGTDRDDRGGTFTGRHGGAPDRGAAAVGEPSLRRAVPHGPRNARRPSRPRNRRGHRSTSW